MAVQPVEFEIKIKKFYLWLWIKYVTGFRSNTHCMNCLVGHRSDKIPPASKGTQPYLKGQIYRGVLNEAGYKYIYLCGVTDEYANNLHVVVKYKAGGLVVHEDEYCKVVIKNAERVPIPKIEQPIDRGSQFTTCRNFMFGYAYLRATDPFDGMTAAEAGINPKYGRPGKKAKKRASAQDTAEQPAPLRRRITGNEHTYQPTRIVYRRVKK